MLKLLERDPQVMETKFSTDRMAIDTFQSHRRRGESLFPLTQVVCANILNWEQVMYRLLIPTPGLGHRGSNCSDPEWDIEFRESHLRCTYWRDNQSKEI